MAGFSFCGIHCSQYGLEYIPSNEDMIPFTPEFDMKEESVTGRYGGYQYGDTIKIQERKLECVFEELTDADMEKIIQWVHHGRTGKLVFDDRPFAYYDVASAKRPTGVSYVAGTKPDGTPCRSGTITFTFHLYEPFARMKSMCVDTLDTENMASYTGAVSEEAMPPCEHDGTGDFLLYNPGTETAALDIIITGPATDGLTITNHTTGDVCRVNSFTSATSKLGIYGETGAVKYGPAANEEYGFEFHNDGYVSLAPCIPYTRNVNLAYTSGSNIVTAFSYIFQEEDVGRYVLLNNKWYRIIYIQDDAHAVISEFMKASGSEATIITCMNELEVTSDGTFTGHIEFRYVPMIR